MDHHPHRDDHHPRHDHDHRHDHHRDADQQRPDSATQSRFLDLDAEVFGDHLAAVLDLSGVPAARSIVDLGAGSGAGSRLLRRRYPDAAITCVDNDPQMLELLRQQGFAVIEADLDEGFPALTGTPTTVPAPVDLVWASSSLHHVGQPERLLAGVRRALAPNGVLAVVELATLPSFLTDPGDVLLERRCHDVASAEGWNNHPDWTPALEAAGFGVTRSEVAFRPPVTLTAREYAEQWFTRFAHLTGLTADDRDAVAGLLNRFHDDVELAPRATRTLWVASADPQLDQP